MKKRKISYISLAIMVVVLIIVISVIICISNDNSELKSIKSEKQLLKIYQGENNDLKEFVVKAISMPFSFFVNEWNTKHAYDSDMYNSNSFGPLSLDTASSLGSASETTSSKDYSKTNIQVENVDEADITKTDGDYIYSISENNVIITDVRDPGNIKIAKTITENDESYPEDLILYNDKLITISSTSSSSYNKYLSNTIVRVYDITNKSNPLILKEFELIEPYYTSRCIGNKLYVIASGRLRENDDKIDTYYIEDNTRKEMQLGSIKYLDDIKTNKQTLISTVNLDNINEDINLTSYLIDISNAYVSENNIYLVDEEYNYNDYVPPISSLFTLKGAIGPFIYEYDEDRGYETKIYKFSILEDGNVRYDVNTNTKGKIINQYSLDESNAHLRIALYDSDGSRIEIFDEKLNKIGESEPVAKGETMYSSRFIGDKVYFVTYKTMDPLFVVDISDETLPKVLGKLKIPGYSTYLHPYDDTHLIGIGMETEEVVNRNSNGKVTSTTSRVIGMKMALFDISDVNNPRQISSTVIGDRRTTSAILTNPKALLFSKEKSLIAIPVNNYSEDFGYTSLDQTYSTLIDSYKNYNKSRISEGYVVYNIDVENGFSLKGIITHDIQNNISNSSFSYYAPTKLLRGLYIDNNLYTVSETAVKVNSLDDLELIDEIKIK